MAVRRSLICLAGALGVLLSALLATNIGVGTGTAAHAQQPLNTPERGVLFRAEELLTQRCMERAGFRYWPQADVNAPVLFSPVPFRLLTLAFAQEYGFGVQPAEVATTTYVEHLPASRQRAFELAFAGSTTTGPQVLVPIPQGGAIGHSADGCQITALDELMGGFTSWYSSITLIENYWAIIQSRVVASHSYNVALRSWRSCTARDGRHWSDPLSAEMPYTSELRASASPLEKRDAGIVAECQQSSGLTATADQLGQMYESALPAAYRKEVEVNDKLGQAAMLRAQEIIANSTQGLMQQARRK
jgi:hypothetical protein